LQIIFDASGVDIEPAAGLLAAHPLCIILGSGHPLLSPTALQQLVLEYQAPVTCFSNEGGFSQPLIAVWGPAVLLKLKYNVESWSNGLNNAIQ
jgi:hypothetical protein